VGEIYRILPPLAQLYFLHLSIRRR
jgi:hypothetical protein